MATNNNQSASFNAPLIVNTTGITGPISALDVINSNTGVRLSIASPIDDLNSAGIIWNPGTQDYPVLRVIGNVLQFGGIAATSNWAGFTFVQKDGATFEFQFGPDNATLTNVVTINDGGVVVVGSIFLDGGILTCDDVNAANSYKINGTQVVISSQNPIANATGAGDVVGVVNTILNMLRTHGLIQT